MQIININLDSYFSNIVIQIGQINISHLYLKSILIDK